MSAVEAGVKTAQAVAAGVYLARDLVNMPPNVATPSKLAEVAADMAEQYGFRNSPSGGPRAWAAERDMGAFLAVAKGAGEEPKFIVLEHGADKEAETVVLVGKGVTFDTGGISIKPGANMGAMKSDMGGAAAVLGRDADGRRAGPAPARRWHRPLDRKHARRERLPPRPT